MCTSQLALLDRAQASRARRLTRWLVELTPVQKAAFSDPAICRMIEMGDLLRHQILDSRFDDFCLKRLREPGAFDELLEGRFFVEGLLREAEARRVFATRFVMFRSPSADTSISVAAAESQLSTSFPRRDLFILMMPLFTLQREYERYRWLHLMMATLYGGGGSSGFSVSSGSAGDAAMLPRR